MKSHPRLRPAAAFQKRSDEVLGPSQHTLHPAESGRGQRFDDHVIALTGPVMYRDDLVNPGRRWFPFPGPEVGPCEQRAVFARQKFVTGPIRDRDQVAGSSLAGGNFEWCKLDLQKSSQLSERDPGLPGLLVTGTVPHRGDKSSSNLRRPRRR